MSANANVENLSIYVNRGITPKYTAETENSILILNQKCIRDYKVSLEPARLNDLKKRKVTEGKILKKYDVLINSTGVGTLGRVAQFYGNTGSATVDSHVTIVRPNQDLIDPVYFGYLLKSKQLLIESFAEGTTCQTELARDSIKNISLEFVKDKKEQKQIGTSLLTLDNKIELNRQINQTLEQITQAVFKNWFVDSEVQEWGVVELGEMLEFNPQRNLKKRSLAPYLDMKNVPTQGHLVDNVYLREMTNGAKFINGDTLLARITPCLENGKTAYIDFLEEDQVAWGSTEYIVMRPRNGRPLSLGYIIARLNVFRAKAIQTMTGTSGRQRVDVQALSKQLWVDYPMDMLNEFDSIASCYLIIAKSNKDQNKTLIQLRDTLLPKLLSGESSTDDA